MRYQLLVLFGIGTAGVSTDPFACSEYFAGNENLCASLLEVDLSTQMLLASKRRQSPAPALVVVVTTPKPVVVVVPPAPPPPTTTTTTTTTTPAGRRRYVASGAAVCEDLSPPDILDSDCWAQRYQLLTAQYAPMQTIGTNTAETGVYLSKLLPVIQAIAVPPLQTSLSSSLAGSVSDLAKAQTAALAAVSSATTAAVARTMTMNQTAVAAANAATSVLVGQMNPAMVSMQGVLVGNLNQLIQHANTLNANASSFAPLKMLTANMSGVMPIITNHSNRVESDLVVPLASQRIALDTALFNATSAFAGSVSAATTAASVAANTRSSSMLASMQGSISNYLQNAAYLGARATLTRNQVSSAAAAWAVNRPAISPQLRSDAQKLFPLLFRNVSAVLALENSTDANVTAQMAALAASALQVANQTYGWVQHNMTRMTNLAANSKYIDTWNSSAQTTIKTLQGYVNAAQVYMNAEALGGTTQASNALMNTILASLAAVGTVQGSINAELLSRQTASMDMANALISKLQANGASFQKVLQSIQFAITALSTAGTKVTPNLGLFAYLQPQLDTLSQAITTVSTNLTANLTRVGQNIDATQTVYQNWVQATWANETARGNNAALVAMATPRIAEAEAAIAAQTAEWNQVDTQMFAQESAAETIGAATLASITNVKTQVEDTIGRLVSALGIAQQGMLKSQAQKLASLQSAAGYSAFTGEIAELEDQVTSAVTGVSNGTVNAFRASVADQLQSMNSTKQTVSAAVTTKVTTPLSALNSALNSASAWSHAQLNNFNSTVLAGLVQVPQIFSEEERSETSHKLSSLATQVDTTLSTALLPDSQVLQPSIPLQASLVASNSQLSLINATLSSLSSSIAQTDRALSLWGGGASQQIANLLGRAATIDKLLQAQAAVQDEAMSAAFAALDLHSRATVVNGWRPAAITNVSTASKMVLANMTSHFTAMRTQLQSKAAQVAFTLPTSANLQDSVQDLVVKPALVSLQQSASLFHTADNNLTNVTVAGGMNASATNDAIAMMEHFIASSASTAKDGINSALDALQAGLNGNQSADAAQHATTLAVDALAEAGAAVTTVISANDLVNATLTNSEVARTNSFDTLANQIATANVTVEGALSTGLLTLVSNSTLAALSGASLALFAGSVQNELAVLAEASQKQQSKLNETTALIGQERSFIVNDLVQALTDISRQASAVNGNFANNDALLESYSDELSDHESWMNQTADGISLDISTFSNNDGNASNFAVNIFTDPIAMQAANASVVATLSGAVDDVDQLLSLQVPR